MAAPDTEQPASTESRSGGFWRVLWVAALLFGLYALSPGPLVRIYRNGATPPAALIAFYAPLEYANDHCDAVEKFYDWYFKLWGAR